MRLQGKSAVVTGAGAGMGRATALLFAEHGAKLVLGDIHAERLAKVADEAKALGAEVTALVGNIAQREDAEALVQAAIEHYGKIDVLVNNAGIMDLFEGAANFRDETYERVMGVNVYGPLVATRAAVRFMKEHGGGSIVNASSAAGVGGGSAGVVYTTSKHAVIGMTKNTAVTYAPAGVRCNAMVIGSVGDTAIGETIDMTRADMEALGQYGKWHGLAPRALASIEVANLALFLASDESKGLNGAVIAVDGGWGAH